MEPGQTATAYSLMVISIPLILQPLAPEPFSLNAPVFPSATLERDRTLHSLPLNFTLEGMTAEKRVLILLGPTAVGKTGVSLLLAEHLETEIISADSMQIYRGMDIGTAKPSPEERDRIRHHMIDIADPDETFSAGRYVDMVKAVIAGLHKEERIPLIVGGTGLYIRTLTRGIFEAPEADRALRKRFHDTEERNPGTLYGKLQELDPKRAEEVHPTDMRRIIRALEVIVKTKRPMSELQRELTTPLPYSFIKIGLTRERGELYRIIEERVDEMFAAGLVEEVRRILRSNPADTPLQAIGYKEVVDYLNGSRDLDEVKWLVKRATKRYAKRQYTWFRKERDIHWVDITGVTEHDELLKRLMEIRELKKLSSGNLV
ncbi:tRNA dimethylallyltransferase [bacterium BMS3Bbin06]|nr:tRNA dimethylallyltransferase [bacterium BMS3Abin08]GBE35242.1 tRNA dimethylallyltransferase [bacterium BMS3Bbin06]HDO36950.1 tRNA (adenosine(37)-N6)-dimethylallyltransferase MiaA [Nitrospirota bacterium]HDY70091.1 tRNA (adenosine(37)-N6)-dimethylallyltransferase MiaA [Nitrospirota bacterium]